MHMYEPVTRHLSRAALGKILKRFLLDLLCYIVTIYYIDSYRIMADGAERQLSMH